MKQSFTPCNSLSRNDGFRNFLVLIVCLLMGSASYGAVIHVDVNAPPGGGGTTWEDAFGDLQSALDVAAATDEIRVADGVYLPTYRIEPMDPRSATFVLVDGVTLEGGYAGIGHPDPDERDIETYTTVLSGDLGGNDAAGFLNREENCYHVVFNYEDGLTTSTVLDGFTISGGNADGHIISGVGGGMILEASSATVIRCTVTDNMASHAAGMRIGSSRSVLTNCTFVNNKATDFGGRGGAIQCNRSELTLARCVFRGNSAKLGAGVSFYDMDGIVTDCLFTENESASGAGLHNLVASPTVTRCVFLNNIGGGMLNDLAAPRLTDCLFNNNVSGEAGGLSEAGGGLENLSSQPVVTNCRFIENSTQGLGGAVANIQSFPTFHNCIFAGNSAGEYCGGIYNFQSPSTVICCTFHGNTTSLLGASMLNNQSSPIVANCNFRGGSSGVEIANVSGSNPVVTYCNVEGGYPGEGNIDAEPHYVDPPHHDYHLKYTSPCRDSGSTEVVSVPETDFEGDPRIVDSSVDIGADEFHRHLYFTGDFTPGGAIEGRLVGVPGTAPVGLFFGTGELDPPLDTAWGPFYIQPPRTRIRLAPIPESGVLILGRTLPTTIPAPSELYLQALIGLDSNSLTNLFVMHVDDEAGTTRD